MTWHYIMSYDTTIYHIIRHHIISYHMTSHYIISYCIVRGEKKKKSTMCASCTWEHRRRPRPMAWMNMLRRLSPRTPKILPICRSRLLARDRQTPIHWVQINKLNVVNDFVFVHPVIFLSNWFKGGPRTMLAQGVCVLRSRGNEG